MQANPKFFGIKRGMSPPKKTPKESCLPLGMSLAPSTIKMPPGKPLVDLSATAPAAMESTLKPDPHQFLQRSSRFALGAKGIVQHKLRLEATSRGLPPTKGVTVTSMVPVEPKRVGPAPTLFSKPRSNPANSLMRLIYERGDLPCIVIPKGSRGAHDTIEFKAPVDKLDYSYYLPIFFTGLREEEYPLPMLADEGIRMMLAGAPEKVLPVIPQLIQPLREALNTRRRPILVRALVALEQLVTCDVGTGRAPRCAQALVPYFRQLLPVMNIYAGKNLTTFDVPDYAQRKNRLIGEKVDALLGLLEEHGGPDAYVNIRYMIPTYMSQKLVA